MCRSFVICSAIPNITNFSALIASACVIQFTYTFPPILILGLAVQRDATLPGEGFNPATGETIRHDHGMKRWIRGFKKHVFLNLSNAVMFLGALTLCGLGMYASIELLILAFKYNDKVVSFTCISPVL